MTTRAFVFPGQGTLRVGMGQWFWHAHASARQVYEEASDLVGRDLTDVCFRGPAAELMHTRQAQPAVFVTNAAAMAVLREIGTEPRAVAGHSVGELNALVAAGVLPFATALRLAETRAEIMASRCPTGMMAGVLGLPVDVVAEACRAVKGAGVGVVTVGLVNAPRYVVISGDAPAVARCTELVGDAGALRVVPLPVSHAFHSPLMAPGVDAWVEIVATTVLGAPRIPIVLNTTGRVAAGTADIRQALVDQFSQPVQWVDCQESLASLGVEELVEVGDSKVLSSFNRSMDRPLACITMADPAVVDRLRPRLRRSVANALS